ncbi:MAG: arsenate reductase (glutaredoxin) [Deltaproteobacteria bacterium]|nr:arsenate reductase (glutaredoxin) [Deltaproteobacteria bacterium]
MLKEKGIPFHYREYRKETLSAEEIRTVLALLGSTAKEVLRTRDAAYRDLGLTGEEGEEELIQAMAAHPTLLQRPIGIKGEKAVVGRPVERLLEL